MQITEESFKGIRHDLDKFFELSGVADVEEQTHFPYIVFNGETIEVCSFLRKLLDEYTDETWVLRQWPGKMRSDFFRFTVGDLRAYLLTKAEATA